MTTTNDISLKSFLLSSALLCAASGCQVNGDVLLGKRGAGGSDGGYAENYPSGPSCPAGSSWRGQVLAVPEGPETCASPSGALASVTAANDGTLHISLRKMEDGKFPTVSLLSYIDVRYTNYYYPGNGGTVQVLCFEGTTSPDGTTQESVCRSTSPNRVSAVNLSSHDEQLVFYQVSLSSPQCGRVWTYTTGQFNSACPVDTAGTPVGSGVFPDLYMEGSN